MRLTVILIEGADLWALERGKARSLFGARNGTGLAATGSRKRGGLCDSGIRVVALCDVALWVSEWGDVKILGYRGDECRNRRALRGAEQGPRPASINRK